MPKEKRPGDDVPPDNHRVKIKSINEALDFLFTRLWEANRLFAEGEDGGREGAIAALNCITEFLAFFEGTLDHRQPLIALLSAVMSLDDGNVPPLLKPIPGPAGAPPPPPGKATRPWRQKQCAGFAKPGLTQKKPTQWLLKLAVIRG
jgi:hypothetical protein